MVRVRLTRKQSTSSPDKLWPEMWKHKSDAAKRKEKQKWAVEKPKLDSARRLRGIFFIDSEDEENKDIMKNARRKLEIPMPAAMPCKTSLCRGSRETCRTIGGHKPKYACIVEADESLRIRMEGSHNKNHEDHIAGKGMNSLSHYSIVHTIIPMPQAMKIPDAKGCSGQGMEKVSRQSQHDNWKKSRARRRLFSKHKETKRKSTLPHWWTYVFSKNAELEPKKSCSVGTL